MVGEISPFPRLVRYVKGEYGTGDWCGLHVVENVDGEWFFIKQEKIELNFILI